jgi:hypothetical protein
MNNSHSALWHDIFDSIWEHSKTETGWVLLGEHVMAVLEQKGIDLGEEGILLNALRFLDDDGLLRLRKAIDERISGGIAAEPGHCKTCNRGCDSLPQVQPTRDLRSGGVGWA